MVSLHFDYTSAAIIVAFYVVGLGLAMNSAFQSRTPQGTMAWFLALTFFPFLAVPAFLLFGKKKLEDYDQYERELLGVRRRIETGVAPYRVTKLDTPLERFLVHTNVDFLDGNEAKLLLDGKETFNEMLTAIKNARRYIFLQMYIFRTDKIGKLFADALVAKAREGVRVFVLYERLGIRMSKTVLRQMTDAGVALGEFSPIRFNKLQVNFRNHRKLLLIDGATGFFGGINIGDDYLGRYPSIGPWRDTNVRVRGPIVSLAQIDFIKDWKFSQRVPFDVELAPPVALGKGHMLLVNSGPAEERPMNLLNHIEIINSARCRLWIANPYIVPPQGILDALFIAAMRGVDVRILVPTKSDNPLVAMAMEVYLERLVKAGIRVFKYRRGMMHQKVILLDEEISVIGSSNFDFRSMYINFENSIVTDDPRLIKDIDLCLRRDFDASDELDPVDFRLRSFRDRLVSHLANSIAPIL
jgi:cardiolipin synthase